VLIRKKLKSIKEGRGIIYVNYFLKLDLEQ